jgi:CRP/FNR family transcriptional regulator, cyclic AMP receptor protein
MYDVDDNMSGSVPPSCRESEFFKALSAAALAELEPLLAPSSYPARASLFNEAQPTTGIYVVLEGEIKLSVNNSDGRRLVFQIAKPGEVIGLWDVFWGGAYEINADTLCAAKVAYVPREVFVEFLSRHREAYSFAAEEVDRSFSLACEQLRMVGLSTPINKRQARLLLVWSDESEKRARDGRTSMTREESDELIGSARTAVIRTVSVFKNQELVARHGCAITAPNRDLPEAWVGD